VAKHASHYVCQSCGAVAAKWAGRCEACGEWNSLVEESAPASAPGGLGGGRRRGKAISFHGLEGPAESCPRRHTGIAELDRVCGGGLVPGSAVLIGGDPGIGKSTLLLQAAVGLGSESGDCAYVSGEESVDQLRLRARRLNLSSDTVRLACATAVRDILPSLEGPSAPVAVIIDSIQTMYVDTLESAPGTVAQVRSSAQELIRLAKTRGFTLFLVGHVTKEGVLAGPRVLEHMVDTVLYFEGERGHPFRILRAVKNRFGPTDEIGVFEMTDREVQALVSSSPQATPRRAVVGWDSGRLAMVLAVLEARCGLVLAGKEVYLNVAGGLRVSEPAADLAVAGALVSAACDKPVPEETVIFGEVGLSGEVRGVSQMDLRLKEAAKLGFKRALVPQRRGRKADGGARGKAATGLEVEEIAHLQDLVDRLSGG
jgi:DNA repair protein RadA/Sms